MKVLVFTTQMTVIGGLERLGLELAESLNGIGIHADILSQYTDNSPELLITETQIRKFINDIFISFWGYEQEKNAEPMFIGTMQLSELKNDNSQHIIDGEIIISRITKIVNPIEYEIGFNAGFNCSTV